MTFKHIYAQRLLRAVTFYLIPYQSTLTNIPVDRVDETPNGAISEISFLWCPFLEYRFKSISCRIARYMHYVH